MKAAWGQVRWKLAVCYVLTGLLSVFLVAAFGVAVVNMLIRRTTLNVVERQVGLLVQTTAGTVDSLVTTLVESEDRPIERALGDRLAAMLAHTAPGANAIIHCHGASGQVVFSYPPGLVSNLPEWLKEDSFRGIVFQDDALHILSFARHRGRECIVEVALRVPLDERQASLISSAAELEVGVPGPPRERPAGTGSGKGKGKGPRAAGSRRTPPSQPRLMFGRILGLEGPGSGALGYLPVIVTARDWQTGAPGDKVAFRVLPNYGTVFRQLAGYGREQALWVFVLGGLAATFLLVQAGALVLAHRVTRRIIASIEGLTRGAAEISRGNLAHRVAVGQSDQLGLLATAFNDMAQSIERLMAEAKENERQEQEILLARRVQESLYPKALPAVAGVELAATWRAARVVSGDLYDVIALTPGHIGLLCADVSGKGFSAALLMANLQAVVRALLRGSVHTPVPSPSEIVGEINAELCRRMPDNRFITLFWADYEATHRVLRYTNAGHCAPVLVTADAQIMRLEEGGLPVGMFPHSRYQEQQIQLDLGSLLLTYTDGIPEALNPDTEEFGDERLISLCKEHRGGTADEVVDHVLRAVRRWQSDAEQFDDITMLAMKVGETRSGPGHPIAISESPSSKN